jgi:hypothetical protein
VYPDPDYISFGMGTGTQPHRSGNDGGDDREKYERLYRFFSQTKAGQRTLLRASGIPVPDTTTRQDVAASWLVPRTEEPSLDNPRGQREGAETPTFIVRPLRHAGGIGFRLTKTPTDFIPGQEYVQRLFPKTREYRLIYVKGTFLVTLRKKVPEGTPRDQPWNHSAGAVFKTINPETCKLADTDCLSRLSANPIIKSAHIVAVDVLWNLSGYVVAEFNSCPGLSIETNLSRIAQHVQVTELVH